MVWFENYLWLVVSGVVGGVVIVLVGGGLGRHIDGQVRFVVFRVNLDDR